MTVPSMNFWSDYQKQDGMSFSVNMIRYRTSKLMLIIMARSVLIISE